MMTAAGVTAETLAQGTHSPRTQQALFKAPVLPVMAASLPPSSVGCEPASLQIRAWSLGTPGRAETATG